MGNTCTPMVDSCQCMAKPIQYCKVISLQLKKKTLKQTSSGFCICCSFCPESSSPEISASFVHFLKCLFRDASPEYCLLYTSSPYFLISSHSLSLTVLYIYIYIYMYMYIYIYIIYVIYIYFKNRSCHLTFIWDYIQIGRILVGNR